MSKHTDVKWVAYTFQVLGLLTFLYSILLVITTDSIFFAIYGLISFVWLYAIGGALLVLVDIAKSVRASAVVSIEQEDRRKPNSKPSTAETYRKPKNAKAIEKSLGLERIAPKKVKGA